MAAEKKRDFIPCLAVVVGGRLNWIANGTTEPFPTRVEARKHARIELAKKAADDAVKIESKP